MKIQDICPSLYRFSHFKYTDKEHKYPRISLEKSQYAYHIILAKDGAFDVCIGDKTERLEAGDALYLLPGDVYRILPCGTDFSLYNLFFDFRDESTADNSRYKNCIFINSFAGELCLPRIVFEDAPILNQSGIFRNVPGKSIRPLLSAERTDAIGKLYERAALLSLVADMLKSTQDGKTKSTVQAILSYIRFNPEKDLSGDALSTRFSYHKNHINKLIRQETGKSLSEYVRYTKIEYAKTLLSEEGCSLSEISARLGYFDYSHFYKAFYKETGMIPAEYIRFFGID